MEEAQPTLTKFDIELKGEMEGDYMASIQELLAFKKASAKPIVD